MLRDDDRFVIYSDLSRVYDHLDPQSSLQLAGRQPADPRIKSPHERRGLAWVMALARVELGAMRAAQTYETRSAARLEEYRRYGPRVAGRDGLGPFDKWPPTEIERDAFVELLLDGARQHYYELRTKYPPPPPVSTGLALPGQDSHGLTTRERSILQQERKLRVTIEMIEALRSYAAGSLTPVQNAELARWLQELGQRYHYVCALLRPTPRRPSTVQQPFPTQPGASLLQQPSKGTTPRK